MHRIGNFRIALLLAAAAQLGACAPMQAAAPAAAAAPACDAQSVASPPGKAWWAQQRWRYASDADAEAAYKALAAGRSPWPDWFTGTQSVLAPGTRFQMAMAPGQPDTEPGGFGTFDRIETAADVREYLAVLVEWKPAIDRVVTFEVVRPLTVETGPVGPQVDPRLCALLPGRWSQFQMMVPGKERMSYLRIVEVRPLQP